MKNFKKVLALVLAVATLLSFATIASATTSADYKDAAAIEKNGQTEAVDVLSAIGVLTGYPDTTFKADNDITRAEAAKIIAMFDNRSADISSLYTSANPFVDAKGNWAESYIAYGYKAGIIAGVGKLNFAPSAKLTGVQFLKMVLVVLGYNAKTEGLEGTSWAVNTLALAKKIGLLDNLPSTFDVSANLTRGNAATIMLNALNTDTVEYGYAYKFTPADIQNIINATTGAPININGYNYLTVGGAIDTGKKLYLAWGLSYANTPDMYGRPGHTWTYGSSFEKLYMNTAVLTYTKAVTACDILVDLGIAKTSSSTVAITNMYRNGYACKLSNGNVISNLTIGHKVSIDDKACDATPVGGQGTLTQVFKMSSGKYRITMIETYLAKVVDVVASKHKGVSDATVVKVYNTADTANYGQDGTELTISGLTSHAKGDYILLNAAKISDVTALNGYVYSDAYTAGSYYVQDLGKATSVTGAQSIIWSEAVASRTVAGTKYALNAQFVKDDSCKKFTATTQFDFKGSYNWFFDTYGNLIGDVTVDTVYSYGVIKDIQWINPAGAYGYANATVLYMDGTKATVKVSTIDTDYTTYTTTNQVPGQVVGATVGVSTSWAENKIPFFGNHLYVISGDAASSDMVQALQLTAANVTTGVSAITGTAGTGATSPIYANSDTVYMVRGVDTTGEYTYTNYTGFNKVPSFTNATVDYVLNASTGYAKYVYITNATNANVSTGLVYLANLSYSYDNNTRLYTMLGAYVAGVQTPVVVNADTFAKLTTAGNVYYVTYANGAGTDAAMINSVNAFALNASTMAIKVHVYDITADAMNLSETPATWNVTNATVYGAAKVTDIAVGSDVVVVYNTATPTTAAAIYALG